MSYHQHYQPDETTQAEAEHGMEQMHLWDAFCTLRDRLVDCGYTEQDADLILDGLKAKCRFV